MTEESLMNDDHSMENPLGNLSSHLCIHIFTKTLILKNTNCTWKRGSPESILLHEMYTCIGRKTSDSGSLGTDTKLKGITVDKSVEFTYEELALATEDFNLEYKIGQGGFGAVFYAELRGEVCPLSY